MPKSSKLKKTSINVYLLRKNPDPVTNGIWVEEDILARNPKLKIRRAILTDRHQLSAGNFSGTLHIRRPHSESQPDWIPFVHPGLPSGTDLSKLSNKSVSAILIAARQGRQFVIAFGHGRHMIEPNRIEDRFGIRVVLNSVSPEEIVSIDRQTFEATPRLSRIQTAKVSSISEFGVDPEQDLLRALVGKAKANYVDALGQIVAGMDSFKAHLPLELSALGGLLDTTLERSLATDYSQGTNGLDGDFAWVDNLLPVNDQTVIAKLEQSLLDKFKSGHLNDIWLAVPEIIDWQTVDGFTYLASQTEPFSTLDVKEFWKTFKSKPNIDTLKNRQIFLHFSTGVPERPLNAFKCIYAEILEGVKQFILNAGKWFQVEESFQKVVQDYFDTVARTSFTFPFIEYDHKGEGPYNEAVCRNSPTTHIMLDRDLVHFGGKHDKIETCDVFIPGAFGAAAGHKFVHVKRGRSSSSLSHLFNQGLVSSTLLLKEPSYLEAVNKQLTDKGVAPLPKTFSAKGNKVIYAIIDGPAGKRLDLPFFSKVTLRNQGRNISTFGYELELLHIPESANFLATEAAKAAAKKVSKSSRASKKMKTLNKAGAKTRKPSASIQTP